MTLTPADGDVVVEVDVSTILIVVPLCLYRLKSIVSTTDFTRVALIWHITLSFSIRSSPSDAIF